MMTQTPTMLAIDAGNTRTKWGLFDAQGNLLETGASLNTQLGDAKFPDASSAIIANVAGETIANTLVQKLEESKITLASATATASACGVVNGYEAPTQLGIDRWAALIGAWHLKKTSCVVVNAGTAMTIDALIAKENNAEFIGGMILPGLDLMQKSLHAGTAQLPNVAEYALNHNTLNHSTLNHSTLNHSTLNHSILNHSILNHGAFFGKNTHEAIMNGTLAATIGAIKSMCEAVKNAYQQTPRLILTGGNAACIQQNFFKETSPNTVMESIEIVENLVLHGLFRLKNHRDTP